MSSAAAIPYPPYDRVPETEQNRAPAAGLGVTFVALLTLLVEGALLIWGLSGAMSIGFLLVLHVVVSVLLFFWAHYLRGEDEPVHFRMLLAFATALLGPAGALGTLVVLGLSAVLTTRSMSDWFAAIFPDERINAAEELVEYLKRYGDQIDATRPVVPFNEVLMLGTPRQKQDMIGLMGRNFHPAFAPALQVALKDDNNAVRIQAATAIGRIENKFANQIALLEKYHKEHPSDTETLLGLARLHDNYAYTGILDPVREDEARRKALSLYRAYLDQHPDSEETCVAIGRVYYRERAYRQLIDWLKSCLDRGLENPSIIGWLMEGHFALGGYEQVAKLAKRYWHIIELEEHLPLELREAVAAWSGPEETPEEEAV